MITNEMSTALKNLEVIRWLKIHRFSMCVAGRAHWLKSDEKTRLGYSAFSEKEAIDIESSDPVQAVIFPGMDEAVDVPEITTECWDILGKKPKAIISNSSGVVFK